MSSSWGAYARGIHIGATIFIAQPTDSVRPGATKSKACQEDRSRARGHQTGRLRGRACRCRVRAGTALTTEVNQFSSHLPPERGVALTAETSPASVGGLFQLAHGTVCDAGTTFEAAIPERAQLGRAQLRCSPRTRAVSPSRHMPRIWSPTGYPPLTRGGQAQAHP